MYSGLIHEYMHAVYIVFFDENDVVLLLDVIDSMLYVCGIVLNLVRGSTVPR